MRYELHYINSKSEEKRVAFETDPKLNEHNIKGHNIKEHNIKGPNIKGYNINDNTILPLCRHLMDTNYHCAMTKVVKYEDEGEEYLFQAQPNASIHSSYVASNGARRNLELPLGSYINGDILTEKNANDLIPELTKQWVACIQESGTRATLTNRSIMNIFIIKSAVETRYFSTVRKRRLSKVLIFFN